MSGGPKHMRKTCWIIGLLLTVGTMCEAGSEESSPDSSKPNWPLVIAQLRQQLDRMPGHALTRKQLAVAYNNYAVELAGQGNLSDAAQQLEEALRVDPSNAQFRTNLVMLHLQAAQEAYQVNRIQDAKAAVTRALALEPKSAPAYALLGEIEYNSQHLKEAKAAWQQALTIDPTLRTLQEKLDQLNQELPVESKFERLSQAYFDIRYTEVIERSTGFDVRDALLEARRMIGSDFAYWPTRKLVVLVYSAEQFRRLRQDTPDWVGGQYDGKIRVPLPSQDLDKDTVTRTLYHEYTHAIIHDLTATHCPTWLNEGLAEYEGWRQQKPTWPLLRQAVAARRLIPWAELSDHFSTALPAQEVALAYEQAHSIVRYLVERYGFWRIRRLLKAVAVGTPLDTTFTQELHIKPPRLEADWRAWLDETLAPSS